MKRNFAKQLLCSVIALMLGIGTVDTVAAQEFVLPEDVKATPAQLKEIKTYYDKAPLLEKFFILTSAYTYCNSGCVFVFQNEIEEVDEVEIMLREINRIKEYKNKEGNAPYWMDSINYQNGYIRICSRALTYWKYDGGKFLIATNLDHDGGCCDGLLTSEPEFFSFDGKEFVETSGRYKGSNGSKVWWMDWFDFFTEEEYIDNCLTMDEDGEPYMMFYFLPSEGKDITVFAGTTGCGPSGMGSSYEARYKWNGDGTFTKVGRSDDYIKQIAEKIKRKEEALKEYQ